jgi:hypothetical protein
MIDTHSAPYLLPSALRNSSRVIGRLPFFFGRCPVSRFGGCDVSSTSVGTVPPVAHAFSMSLTLTFAFPVAVWIALAFFSAALASVALVSFGFGGPVGGQYPCLLK